MTKVIYFRERTDTPLKAVKDKPGVSECQKCYFKGSPDGCPTPPRKSSLQALGIVKMTGTTTWRYNEPEPNAVPR